MEERLTRQQLRLVFGSFLFQGVDELLAEQLASDQRCFQRRYERGAVVFDETHFLRCLGILLSGELRVEKTAWGGRRLNMSRLRPGECFGAAAMFHSRDRYAAILTAEKPAQVLFLPQELIAWAMRRDPEITENYIAYLSDRIWFLNEKISSLTAGTAEQRLGAFLLERGSVSQPMTELSRQLNMGRATLYRALEDLESRELIRREGKTISVTGVDGLRQLILSS